MAESLREALRDRLTVRAAAQWVAVGAVLWYVLDPGPAQFVTTTVSLAVFGLTELVTDVYDVRQAVRNVGLGVYALVGGSAMLLLGDPNMVALPVVFLLVGAWFVLDAVQTYRHEGATEDDLTGREVYRDYVGRRVHEALEAGPRTRRELDSELDADRADIEAAVDRLESRGVVVREGSALRLADREDPGLAGRAVGKLTWLARRVARPFALELGDETGSGDSDRSRVGAETLCRAGREASIRGETADSNADGAHEGGDEQSREQERESAD